MIVYKEIKDFGDDSFLIQSFKIDLIKNLGLFRKDIEQMVLSNYSRFLSNYHIDNQIYLIR